MCSIRRSSDYPLTQQQLIRIIMPTIAKLTSKVDTLQRLLANPNIADKAWQLALEDAVERVAEYSINHSYPLAPAEEQRLVA